MSKSALIKTRTSQELFDRLERIRLDPRVRRERSDFYRVILEDYATRAEQELTPRPAPAEPRTVIVHKARASDRPSKSTPHSPSN